MYKHWRLFLPENPSRGFFSPRENPKRIKCEKFESQKERWLSCLAWRLHRQAVLSGNTFQAGKSSSWIFLFFLSLNQQLKSPPSSRAAGTWLWIFTVIPGRVSQEMNPSIRKSVSLPALPCRCSVATGGYPPLYQEMAEKARADFWSVFDVALPTSPNSPPLSVPAINPSIWLNGWPLSQTWAKAAEDSTASSCLVTRQISLIFKDCVLVHVVV